jgi:SAM-dependent methyltransferase
VDQVFGIVSQLIEADFAPAESLNFGCGVGRLLLPIAQRGTTAVEIDVSPGMMAEATAKLHRRGMENVDLHTDMKDLIDTSLQFDFVHSFIVLEHIPTRDGYVIVEQLIDLLRLGGVGVVQLSYVDRRRTLSRWLGSLPLPNDFRNLKARTTSREPIMQMNAYDLNLIFGTLADRGITQILCRATDHGLRGVPSIFAKLTDQRPTGHEPSSSQGSWLSTIRLDNTTGLGPLCRLVPIGQL